MGLHAVTKPSVCEAEATVLDYGSAKGDPCNVPCCPKGS